MASHSVDEFDIDRSLGQRPAGDTHVPFTNSIDVLKRLLNLGRSGVVFQRNRDTRARDRSVKQVSANRCRGAVHTTSHGQRVAHFVRDPHLFGADPNVERESEAVAPWQDRGVRDIECRLCCRDRRIQTRGGRSGPAYRGEREESADRRPLHINQLNFVRDHRAAGIARNLELLADDVSDIGVVKPTANVQLVRRAGRRRFNADQQPVVRIVRQGVAVNVRADTVQRVVKGIRICGERCLRAVCDP